MTHNRSEVVQPLALWWPTDETRAGKTSLARFPWGPWLDKAARKQRWPVETLASIPPVRRHRIVGQWQPGQPRSPLLPPPCQCAVPWSDDGSGLVSIPPARPSVHLPDWGGQFCKELAQGPKVNGRHYCALFSSRSLCLTELTISMPQLKYAVRGGVLAELFSWFLSISRLINVGWLCARN